MCIFLQLSLLDVLFLPPPLYVGAVRSRGNCAPVTQPDTGGVRRRRCFMSSPTLCRSLVECPPIWTNLPSWESPSASCGCDSSSRLVRSLPGLSWGTKLQICPARGDQCLCNLNKFRLVLRFFCWRTKTDSWPLSSFPAASDGEKKGSEEDDPMDGFYPQTLAGFIMVLTEEGDMIFLTENVNKYIGIVQVRSPKKLCGNDYRVTMSKNTPQKMVYIEFRYFFNDASINGCINSQICLFLTVGAAGSEYLWLHPSLRSGGAHRPADSTSRSDAQLMIKTGAQTKDIFIN